MPARGKVTNGTSIKVFSDMVVTGRDRVQHMVNEGRTEDQVVAARPTHNGGHGRVPPDAFVREVCAALGSGGHPQRADLRAR